MTRLDPLDHESVRDCLRELEIAQDQGSPEALLAWCARWAEGVRALLIAIPSLVEGGSDESDD